jgi:ESCRT-I complex subunit TSG101
MRQASLKQDEMSLSGLAAQRTALAVAAAKMQTELGELHQLSQLLASNSSILHDAQHKADAVMDRSKNHAGVDIDELLVPRTVVASQLYTLVAEERAIGDAIYSLSRAMEKGRVSTPVFIKLTRSLAREWFLKKALIQKIAEGMGLATERRS